MIFRPAERDSGVCVRTLFVPGGLRGFFHFTQHSATLRAGLSCHAPAALCFSSFLLLLPKRKASSHADTGVLAGPSSYARFHDHIGENEHRRSA